MTASPERLRALSIQLAQMATGTEAANAAVARAVGLPESEPLTTVTMSVDVGLAMVRMLLPGWTVANLGEEDNRQWYAELRCGHLTSYSRVVLSHLRCNTTAIALCCAMLRALAVEREKD